MLITAFEGEDLLPHKTEDSKMYPLNCLKMNWMARIQRKSNLDSECGHHVIIIIWGFREEAKVHMWVQYTSFNPKH